jgi:hypothetical protein
MGTKPLHGMTVPFHVDQRVNLCPSHVRDRGVTKVEENDPLPMHLTLHQASPFENCFEAPGNILTGFAIVPNHVACPFPCQISIWMTYKVTLKRIIVPDLGRHLLPAVSHLQGDPSPEEVHPIPGEPQDVIDPHPCVPPDNPGIPKILALDVLQDFMVLLRCPYLQAGFGVRVFFCPHPNPWLRISLTEGTDGFVSHANLMLFPIHTL